MKPDFAISAQTFPGSDDADQAERHAMIGLKVRIHQRLIELLNLSVLERTSRENLRSAARSWPC